MKHGTVLEAMEAGVDCRYVPGWGRYMVDEAGTVYGQNGRARKLCPDERGYVRVTLSRDGSVETRYAHRIIWEAFHGKIPDGLEVHHIDHDASNNAVENLALMDHWSNICESVEAGRRFDLGGWSRSNGRAVIGVDEDGEREFESLTVAAKCAGGERANPANIVHAIKRGGVSYGYRWRYAS